MRRCAASWFGRAAAPLGVAIAAVTHWSAPQSGEISHVDMFISHIDTVISHTDTVIQRQYSISTLTAHILFCQLRAPPSPRHGSVVARATEVGTRPVSWSAAIDGVSSNVIKSRSRAHE